MFTFHFKLPAKIVEPEVKQNSSTNRGEIYIETENGYFPCIGWSDRLLSVVMMWTGNAIQMLDPKYGEQNTTNYFMDGPYSFDIQKAGEDRAIIRFMRRVGNTEKEEMPCLTIAFSDYCKTLLSLTENIIRDPDFEWIGKEQERINFKQSVAMFTKWL